VAEEHDQAESAPEGPPKPARTPRPSSDIVGNWLESQRRTEAILNPRVLGLIEPSWLKAMSGAAAMPEVTKLFTTRDFNFAAGVFADLERARRIFGGVNPALDAARQMRALSGVGAFPAIHEATLAHERLAKLIQPLDIPMLTRDLAGVSDAVTSVASMIRPPAIELSRELTRIASSALGSWRTYVDAMPPALDVADLFGAQAAARGVLGITATSAILLGDHDAVEVAEEWELAPAEARERMRDGLVQISPRLLIRLDGAWDAIAHAGPDSASQAANSAIELIDWTLRLACDAVGGSGVEAWILEQAKPSRYRDKTGRPTRAAKIRYLLRESEFEADFVEAAVRNLDALRGELQKLKHTHGSHNVEAVARLLPSVEAVLFLIVD
jgi:hypothetical protein